MVNSSIQNQVTKAGYKIYIWALERNDKGVLTSFTIAMVTILSAFYDDKLTLLYSKMGKESVAQNGLKA